MQASLLLRSFDVHIRPEPSAEERLAILAALTSEVETTDESWWRAGLPVESDELEPAEPALPPG